MRTRFSRICRAVVWAAAGTAAVFALFTLGIAIYGLTVSAAPADVAVILGNKVRRNGSPSARLEARLTEGLCLLNESRVRYLLVSGGHGREGYSEAAVMRDWLLSHDAPGDRVLVDPAGDNTWLTAQHSSAIMKEHGLKDAVIVSQYFHLARCRLLFSRAGVDITGCSAPSFWELRDIYSLPREAVAFGVYATGIKGRD